MRLIALSLVAFGGLSTACLLADTNQVRELAQNASPASGESDAANKSDKAAPAASGKAKAKGRQAPGLTPEREAAAKTFVEQHHPELAQLLIHLRENNPKEYEKAVRDLFRTSERLAFSHERDPERYDLELKAWQAQSRMDLLTARYKMTPNAELKSQLQRVIVEQIDLRKSLLTLERQRAQERFEKADDQLRNFEKSRNEAIERQIRLLLGSVEPAREATPTVSDPTVKPTAAEKSKTDAAAKSSTPPPTSKSVERSDKPAVRGKDGKPSS